MNNLILVSVYSRESPMSFDELILKMKQELVHSGDDCRVGKNVWCFDTDASSEQIFRYLYDHIDKDTDDLVVAKLDGEWFTNGATQDDCSKKGRGRPRDVFSPHPGAYMSGRIIGETLSIPRKVKK